MLGATTYLSMKPVKCPDPNDPEFEEALIALNVEFFCQGTMRRNDELIEALRAISPHATAHGQQLFASGALREAVRAGVPMEEALDLLAAAKR